MQSKQDQLDGHTLLDYTGTVVVPAESDRFCGWFCLAQSKYQRQLICSEMWDWTAVCSGAPSCRPGRALQRKAAAWKCHLSLQSAQSVRASLARGTVRIAPLSSGATYSQNQYVLGLIFSCKHEVKKGLDILVVGI